MTYTQTDYIDIAKTLLSGIAVYLNASNGKTRRGYSYDLDLHIIKIYDNNRNCTKTRKAAPKIENIANIIEKDLTKL